MLTIAYLEICHSRSVRIPSKLAFLLYYAFKFGKIVENMRLSHVKSTFGAANTNY